MSTTVADRTSQAFESIKQGLVEGYEEGAAAIREILDDPEHPTEIQDVLAYVSALMGMRNTVANLAAAFDTVADDEAEANDAMATVRKHLAESLPAEEVLQKTIFELQRGVGNIISYAAFYASPDDDARQLIVWVVTGPQDFTVLVRAFSSDEAIAVCREAPEDQVEAAKQQGYRLLGWAQLGIDENDLEANSLDHRGHSRVLAYLAGITSPKVED